ncbi:MAG: S1/P1 nuclease [Candidatus Sericytochromatia bacterium]
MMAPPPAQAWWDTGHMITAQIAHDALKPEVRAEVDRLIRSLDVAETTPERRHFVPASVWMDETKARGLKSMDPWHYANLPYNPDGLPKINAVPENNILTHIEGLSKTLENPKAGDFEKAFALRCLIHLVGDIHQPFHAVSRSNHEHSDGDQGGNLVKIEGAPQTNLHSFWDSTANYFPSVRSENWQPAIPGMAAEVLKLWPKAKLRASLDFAPVQWSIESYHLAVKNGYEALPSSGPISADYVRKAQEICLERLSLGGFRLAELLNTRLQKRPQ